MMISAGIVWLAAYLPILKISLQLVTKRNHFRINKPWVGPGFEASVGEQR